MWEGKDYPVDGADRSEWDRLWSAQTQRRLPGPCRIDLGQFLPGQSATGVTIAADPVEFASRVHRTSDVCPVCGSPTIDENRLGASLDVPFRNGSLGIGVWVHPACFEACEDTGIPARIPW